MDTGSLIFYGGVTVWSAFVAYVLLFSLTKPKPSAPEAIAPRPVDAPRAVPTSYGASVVPGKPDVTKYGFKAFQSGEDLSVEDIVKGLSRG